MSTWNSVDDFDDVERPLSTAWITDDLIELTLQEMSPLYDYELTEDDAIEILMNLKRFAEALLKAVESQKTEGEPRR